MKKGIITSVTILVSLILIVILATPQSVAQISISNLKAARQIQVEAPWGIFRGGVLIVFAEGELTGKGTLHIYSNNRRDYQAYTFEDEKIRIQINDPEAWVGNLQVEWEPINVKDGKMELFIGCGSGLDELQEWSQQLQP